MSHRIFLKLIGKCRRKDVLRVSIRHHKIISDDWNVWLGAFQRLPYLLKVSAVGEECFAVVRTSVYGTESHWFNSSHQFAGVVQNPHRLSPHYLSGVEQLVSLQVS